MTFSGWGRKALGSRDLSRFHAELSAPLQPGQARAREGHCHPTHSMQLVASSQHGSHCQGAGHSTVAQRMMEWPLIVCTLKPGKCWQQKETREAAGSRLTGWSRSSHPPKQLNGRLAKATVQSATHHGAD
jgi:hypothetical protein